MALQTSGAISLLNIANEFGGAAPHSISEYRGVDGTPASGAISFSNFYGKSAYTAIGVSVPNGYRLGRADRNASLILAATVSNGNGTQSFAWTKVSGSSSVFISGSSTGSSVIIVCTTPGRSGIATATFRCTVNDGRTTANDTGFAQFEWGAFN